MMMYILGLILGLACLHVLPVSMWVTVGSSHNPKKCMLG